MQGLDCTSNPVKNYYFFPFFGKTFWKEILIELNLNNAPYY